MTASIDMLEEAREELIEAVSYYRESSITNALTFEKVINAAIDRIIENPERYPIRKGYRRCVLVKYPYTVFYRILERGPQIVAVAHHKRRNMYWLSRTD